MLTGRETEFSDLGIRDYRKVWEMQQQVLEEVKQRKMQGKAVPGYLFLWSIRLSIPWERVVKRQICSWMPYSCEQDAPSL